MNTDDKNIKVVLFSAKSYDKTSFDLVNEKYGFDIEYHEDTLSEQNLILTKGADVVCVFVNDVVTDELIEGMLRNDVKLLALRCAGFNNVDLKAAQNRLPVVRVPAYSPHAVAEYTLSLMLTLNRKIHRAYWRTKDGNFALHGLSGFDMYGKTVGVIGTGKIAKILIKMLRAMGMIVLGYDVYPDNKFAEEVGMSYVTLNELFERSDIITLHCPLTSDNKHMINEDSISKMKTGVMIINTGRGQLINSTALVEGLKTRKVGAAGLDVYEEEGEYFYEDLSDKIINDDTLARLLSFNNVIVTSHQAYFTTEALHNIASTTLENIQQCFKYGQFPNAVLFA